MLRFVVPALVVLWGCGLGGEPVEEAASDPAGSEVAEEEAAGEPVGTLVVSGEELESPATHDVQVGCSYGGGSFTIGAFGETAAGHLSVTMGNPRFPIPFEDGSYTGRFSYDEPRSDGRMLSYHGEATATVEILDRSGTFPRARVSARGSEQGFAFEVEGRCDVPGA